MTSMRVHDFLGTTQVNGEELLRELLSRRLGAGFNEFECYHESDYPLLTMWANGSLACLAFWSDPDTMELYSRGDGVVPAEGETEVRMGSLDNIDARPNVFVVRADAAVAAVVEFMHTKELPKVVQWLQP